MRPVIPEFYTNSPPIRLAVSMVEQLRAAVSGDAKGFFATENNDLLINCRRAIALRGPPAGLLGRGEG